MIKDRFNTLEGDKKLLKQLQNDIDGKIMECDNLEKAVNYGRCIECGEPLYIENITVGICDDCESTITFDDLIKYGNENGANIVDGMPWSFEYKGTRVTHENDDQYFNKLFNYSNIR